MAPRRTGGRRNTAIASTRADALPTAIATQAAAQAVQSMKAAANALASDAGRVQRAVAGRNASHSPGAE